MAAVDRVYRGILAATRFFSKGWGPPRAYENLLELLATLKTPSQTSSLLADHTHSINIHKVRSLSWGNLYTGSFTSPLSTLRPDMLPEVATTARFELLLPKMWRSQPKPVYIHLAGTGDHAFWRRRHMTALPLLKNEGIGALLLENPFYGSRKPKGQTRSQLNQVSDILVMGLALILECNILIGWLEREGLGPVGLTGISMGGHNASLAAALYPRPVPVVPCLSWATASCVFTEGILSEAVCWDVLEDQLMLAKQGYDDRLMNIFKIAVEQETSGLYSQDNYKQTHSSSNENHDRPTAGSHDFVYFTGETGLTGDENLFSSHPAIVPVMPRRPMSHTQRETLSLMQAVLNSATHFSNYPKPAAPELALFIAANKDLYIPRHNVTHVQTLWPGCKVEYIPGGHVSSIVTQQSKFRVGLASTMHRTVTEGQQYQQHSEQNNMFNT